MEPEATASSIKASLNQLDYTVSISWKVPTDECAKYVSSLWVKIYESGNPGAASLAQYLTVPISCLKKNPDKSLSLVVHSNSTDGVFSQEKEECQLSSGAYLSECHAYTVELVPNYQSLKGNALLSEIVVPPRLVFKI